MIKEPKSNEDIIEEFLDNPEGAEVRSAALSLTNLGFNNSVKDLLPTVFADRMESNDILKQEVYKLLADFRVLAKRLLNFELRHSDDALFKDIVLPLITRLIRRSA